MKRLLRTVDREETLRAEFRPHSMRGFTLLELMITVAIVGLLAAIAYPAYTDSVMKGRRAEGRTALLNLLQQQERYYTQTGSYLQFVAGAVGDLGANAAGNATLPIPFRTTSGESVDSSAYTLSAATCADGVGLDECVMLSAIPRFDDADAGTLSITSAGVKTCNGARSTVPRVCW